MTERPVLDEELKEKTRQLLSPLNLASQSPNRLELLRECGVEVTAFAQNIDESVIRGTTAEETCRAISRRKLESFMASPDFDPDVLSLALDTMVSFEGRKLGKAANREEAFGMLSSFSGKEQRVATGYCIYIPHKGILETSVITPVLFRVLDEDEINSYLDTGEWIGAAGAYRIQKTGWKLVDRIDGSWTNVVGMPLESITTSLSQLYSSAV